METKPIVLQKNGKKLYAAALAAFFLGILFGILTPGIFPKIAFLGEIYVRLLKLLVVPIMMAQIITGVSGAGDAFSRRLLRTVLLFICMFAVSFCLMAILTGILQPGKGSAIAQEAWEGEAANATLSGFLTSIIPSNIFASMSSGDILPCTLFSFLVGIAAAKLNAQKLIGGIGELSEVLTQVLAWSMYLTPFGVFSLMGSAVAEHGAKLIGTAAAYILLAWGGCLLVTLFVMILPVWLYAGVSPSSYIRKVCPIWLTTLSTCSSAATLPHTMRVCRDEFSVSEEIVGITAPLGCTIHMCGGAVSFCLLAMFSLQTSGMQLTVPLFLNMLFVATLINMAAPGIPGGGIAIGAAYLGIIGAPTGFIGVYSGIYRLLDMAYTSVNVTGDITANILLAEKERREKLARKADKDI